MNTNHMYQKMKNTSHSHGRGDFIILLIICTLLRNCKSQESEELNIIDDVPDDIFLKDESFSDSPTPTMLDFSAINSNMDNCAKGVITTYKY